MHDPRALGTDLISSDAGGAESAPRSTRQQRPRRLLGRALSGLAWVFFGVAAVALYTNVLADDAPLRRRTEAVAREHAGCGATCQVTAMVGRRTVIEFQAEYAIEGVAPVRVACRRSAIVAGDHACSVRGSSASPP